MTWKKGVQSPKGRCRTRRRPRLKLRGLLSQERKEKDGWRLEPEGEAETLELWNDAEGVPANPDGESHHERAQAKSTRREREAPGEEGEELKKSEEKSDSGGIPRHGGSRQRTIGLESGGS